MDDFHVSKRWVSAGVVVFNYHQRILGLYCLFSFFVWLLFERRAHGIFVLV